MKIRGDVLASSLAYLRMHADGFEVIEGLSPRLRELEGNIKGVD